MSEEASRPFGKYERYGAYHWREIERLPTRHNAVLTARYHVLLDAMDAGTRRVLDVGCGNGTLTYRLAQKSERVWGVDDSLLPLQLARGQFERDRGDRPFLTSADARILPFRGDTFDCVVMAEVFGRKLFRIAINCCAIAGWNPLAKTGDVSDDTRHTDLCAWGQKA